WLSLIVVNLPSKGSGIILRQIEVDEIATYIFQCSAIRQIPCCGIGIIIRSGTVPNCKEQWPGMMDVLRCLPNPLFVLIVARGRNRSLHQCVICNGHPLSQCFTGYDVAHAVRGEILILEGKPIDKILERGCSVP